MTTDLDDLPTLCQEPHGREMITEAVSSYKAGAYRSTITYTWVAVVLNLNHKIEQLALTGDAEADILQKRMDSIRKTNDISGLLAYERDILTVARTKFELFDDIVWVDLKRLQEDRNRCSHPLLHADDDLYRPTAEQARHHLRIAVENLLSEPNVYGKSVLDKTLALINSSVFPHEAEDVARVLDGSYLASPKDSLVRNLALVLVKELLSGRVDRRQSFTYPQVLRYLLSRKRTIVERVLADKLPTLVDCTGESPLSGLHRLLSVDPVVWEQITEDKRILIREFVRNLPGRCLADAFLWYDVDPLRSDLACRISHASRLETPDLIGSFLFCETPQELSDRIVTLYLGSGNFQEANAFAKTVASSLVELGRDRITKIIRGARQNPQVMASREFGTVVTAIRKSTMFHDDELDDLLRANDLSQFATVPP